MSGVYVITDGEHYKIGVAVDPAKRLRELQTGNPRRLRLTFFVALPNPETAAHVERSAHHRIGRNRRVGEWFACDQDCAVWAIMKFAYPGCLEDDEAA